MDFLKILKTQEVVNQEHFSTNPFAGKTNGEWTEGFISVEFLNEHFGHLETVEEMKNATESEGLKLYFDWLKQKGILN